MFLKRMYSWSIQKFENAFGSRIAFWAYTFLSYLSKTKYSFFLRFNAKLSDKETIFRKYHDIGYRCYFLKPDLKLAYRLRLEHAIHLEKSSNGETKKNASNYLDIIFNDELISLINLKKEDISYLKNRKWNNDIFGFDSNKKKKVGKMLFMGPASDPYSIKFEIYDYIVLNKPLLNEDLGINPQKIILVLNNWFTMLKSRYEQGEKQQVLDWIKRNKVAKVFSPNHLGFSNEDNEIFQTIPSFPFRSGPMGLQRALTIILHYYDFTRVDLIGYNFSLEHDSYKPWYPSRAKLIGQGSIIKGNQLAFLKHDFLLNVLYTKKLVDLSNNKISGSIDSYINRPISSIISLYEKIYINH